LGVFGVPDNFGYICIMRVAWVIILSLIAAVGTVGCDRTDTSVVDCLHRLGGLVFVDPDSASVVLNGIRREDLRDDDSKSRYDLLQTMIDDRLGNVHRSPDDILSVRSYFIGSDASDSLLTIVHLYTGRVYEDLGEYPKALESYLEARTHAEDTAENHLKGRIFYNIGNLYHNDYDYAHASSFLEQAIPHFNAIGDTLNAANTYNLLGANHTVSGSVDKGLQALNKANEMYGSLRNKDGIMSSSLTIAGLYLYHMEDAAKADSIMTRVHNNYNGGTIPHDHLPMMSQIEAGKGNYEKAIEFLQDYLGLTFGRKSETLCSYVILRKSDGAISFGIRSPVQICGHYRQFVS
jgi:tetratricopeptide (TPR) repeat protein